MKKRIRIFLQQLLSWEFYKIIFSDLLHLQNKNLDNIFNIKKQANFLENSFVINKQTGSAICYYPKIGNRWSGPYPETTGYIIETFIDLYNFFGDIKYIRYVKKMGDWLLSLQYKEGAFPGDHGESGINKGRPVVFNTGQIIFGLVSLYKYFNNEKYILSAEKACKWLCRIIEKDGGWKKSTYKGSPRAYHSRVAWAMLEYANLKKDFKIKEVAISNLDWVISNQNKNGFFKHCGFLENQEEPFLHTIAYTIRGLLESYLLTNDKLYLDSALLTAEKLLLKFEIEKHLNGQYNNNWKYSKKFSCITGNAQIAIIWMKIFKINHDYRYLNAALKLNDFNKKTNRYGIKGSHPFWASYKSFSFPNWASKFFLDSLILEENIMKEIANEKA